MLNEEIRSLITKNQSNETINTEDACKLMDAFIISYSEAIRDTEDKTFAIIENAFSLEEIKKYDNTNLSYFLAVLLMHSPAVTGVKPMILLECTIDEDDVTVTMQIIEVTLIDDSCIHICALKETKATPNNS